MHQAQYTESNEQLLVDIFRIREIDKRLFDAVRAGEVEEARKLIAEGACVNIVNPIGYTPLLEAAKSGYSEMVDILIKGGADFNRSECGSVIFIAAMRAFANSYHIITIDVLKEMFEHIQSNKHGITPLHLAAEKGHIKIVDTLIKAGANFDITDKNGKAPLHLAAEKGHIKIVDTLIKAGANFDITDKNGKAPLHFAAEKGHTKIVDTLIKAGANFDIMDKNGKAPLHFAAEKGYTEIVGALIKAGANFDIMDKNGKAPLHFAAEKGYTEIVDALIKAGANFGITDKNGKAPLHFAVSNGHLNVVKYLIEEKEVEHENEEFLYLAASKGHLNVVKYFIEEKKKVSYGKESFLLYSVASEGFLSVLQYFIEKGANPDISKRCNTSLLHAAASRGHLDIIKYLVEEKGCDPDVKQWGMGRRDGTPLHLAAEKGHIKIVDTLIKAGANVDITDENAMTPLHLAAEEGHTKIVDTLIKAGANIDITNENGITTLRKTVEKGFIECSKTIIRYAVLFDHKVLKQDFITNDILLSHFWEDCKSQVEKMQGTLGTSTISWYKFLREIDENKLVGYLSNESSGVQRELEEARYAKDFSIYTDIIEDHFSKGKRRGYLLNICSTIMEHSNLKELPAEIRSKITNFLSNADLEDFKKFTVDSVSTNFNDPNAEQIQAFSHARN